MLIFEFHLNESSKMYVTHLINLEGGGGGGVQPP